MRRPALLSRPLALPFLLLALLLAPLAVSAAESERRQAQGRIEGKSLKFEAYGAYAFPAEVGLGDEPGIKVAISNAGFIAEGLDRDYDREFMIDSFFKDDETPVAYFHFSRTGAYKGVSYAFGSGDGCGLCFDGSAQSTVKVEGGRIHGSLKLVESDSLRFDVSFDVPVAPAEYGDPLPADGGDPGKAYAALHGLLVARDYAAAKPYFTDESQADWKEHAQEILESYRKEHPVESYRIVRGWLRGGHALLLVEGEGTYGKIKTEAQMVRQNGTWRLSTETMQMRIGE